MPGKVFIVSAPSGAGKTTLVAKAIEELTPHYPLERVITYTSRLPRRGEKTGVDYHFITEQEFIDKISAGFFFEYSTVYGTYYGLPSSLIDKVREGCSYIMILDRDGAQRVSSVIPDAITIWIHVGLEQLKERLIKRGSETAEQIARRLVLATAEYEQEKQAPRYNFYVHNDKINESFYVFKNILLKFLSQASAGKYVRKTAYNAEKEEFCL